MKKSSAPKRPMTAFFLFAKKMRENGEKMSNKEAGEKWNSLSDSEKRPYLDAYKKEKDKFDKYLESEGITVKGSVPGKKATSYNISKILGVCSQNDEHKGMSGDVCRGLKSVIQAFIKDLAENAGEVMKTDLKRTVTVEVIEKAMEAKKYRPITKLKAYDEIVSEANKAAEKERTKRRKSKLKDDSEESEDEKAKKKKKGKAKAKGKSKSKKK